MKVKCAVCGQDIEADNNEVAALQTKVRQLFPNDPELDLTVVDNPNNWFVCDTCCDAVMNSPNKGSH